MCMITKFNTDLILAFLPDEDPGQKYCAIAVSGKSNFKISEYTSCLLDLLHLPYQKDNNSNIGRAQYILKIAQIFGESEKWIFREEHLDKARYNADLLYTLQSLKGIFSGYVDRRIKSQDTTVAALILWYVSRQYELKNNLQTTGWVDHQDDEPEPPTPKAAPQPKQTFSPVDGEDIFTLQLPQPISEDLLEELEPVHVPIPADPEPQQPPTRQLLADESVYEAFEGHSILSEHKTPTRKTGIFRSVSK